MNQKWLLVSQKTTGGGFPIGVPSERYWSYCHPTPANVSGSTVSNSITGPTLERSVYSARCGGRIRIFDLHHAFDGPDL
jgi:hypothetical protein